MLPKYVLDANLLVLLVVGLAGRREIEKHKRLSNFAAVDFDRLNSILIESSGVVLTPNVLTETSNLLRFGSEAQKLKWAVILASLCEASEELHIAAREAMKRPEYRWLGLTDAVLLCVVTPESRLLTADEPLHDAAFKAGSEPVLFIPHKKISAR